VQQSSAAFQPTASAVEPIAKAPEGWRSPRRWRDFGRTSRLRNAVRDILLACLAGIAGACVTACAAELRLGQETVPPGVVVSVPVTCAGASGAVGAQFDVSFNSSVVSWAGIAAGESLSGHIVDQQQLAPGQWRVLVYSVTNGPIAPGAVVWVSFNVPTNAPDGVVPLAMTNAIVAQIAGHRVQPLVQAGGALTIWSGGSFLSMTLESGRRLQMQFQGVEGRHYAMEASTNLLKNWVILGTNTVVGGTISLLETNTAAFPQRFYRTRLVP
jgi:hypothetical protein